MSRPTTGKSINSKNRLSTQRIAFLNYYLQGNDCYISAIKAGYANSTAKKSSYNWLQDPLCKEYIDKQLAKVDKSNILSITDIQEWWSNLITNKNADMKDRIRASELLAKSAGGFTEKIDMNTNQQVVFIDDIGVGDDNEKN